MLLVIAAAVVVAMLPGMHTAAHVDSTDRTTGAYTSHSFPLESVRAIAISLDRGKVTLDVAGADASSADVEISVVHSVASTAESSLLALSTSVNLDDSTGALTITVVWNGGVEDAFAAPSAEVLLEIPRSLSTETLSVEVKIGNVDTGFGQQSSGDQALSIPWRGFASPVGDIVWKGDDSTRFGRVSLATIEGSITVTDLRAVDVSAASDHGASISLKRVSAHILTVVSGVAAIDAEVTVTGQDDWPAAGRIHGIQWVAPRSTNAGGWLSLLTSSASYVRLSLGSDMGGQSGRSGAAALEVDCGSRSGATCILEVPTSSRSTTNLCGSVVAKSESTDGGGTAATPLLFPDAGSNAVAVLSVQDASSAGLSAHRTATLELQCSGAQTDGWIRGSVITRAATVHLRPA